MQSCQHERKLYQIICARRLSGTEDEIRKVALSYKVFYEKVPVRGSDQYLIDHTSFTYALDVEGRYAGYFPPGTTGRRLAEQVKSMLAVRPSISDKAAADR